jgi:pimeloyl-ACP methyl ester carboxylesterase
MHGWGGFRAHLEPLVKPLTAKGYQVIALDAPSHGSSRPGAYGRKRSTLPEFADALNAVVAANGPAHAVIGHSLGGTASALAVLDGLPAERLVTIGSVVDAIPYTVEFARDLGFGERIRTGFIKRLERRVGRSMEDFSLPHRARTRTDLPPLLVIHDRQDKEVHHRDAIMLAGAWRGSDLLLTDGLGHRRILADAEVARRIVDFIGAASPDEPGLGAPPSRAGSAVSDGAGSAGPGEGQASSLERTPISA